MHKRGHMTNTARIKEIFTSIQGEGPFIGYKQLFIRFCGCNLNCSYCDTDFSADNSSTYTVDDLVEIIKKHKDCHSVAFTGGEPLLNTVFLKDLLPQCHLPVYLETNATLAGELGEIIDYIDYISADIKLASCSNNKDLFSEHDRFFSVASCKTLFAKIVFDSNITQMEIENCCKLGGKYNVELILQPRMINDKPEPEAGFIEQIHNKFLKKYKKTRVIPQVHKFLNVR